MGTPLPPIVIEPGVPCTLCFGTDKTHPDPTPASVFMTLNDWSEGQNFDEAFRDELEGAQELDQQPSFPCIWAAFSDHFLWFLVYDLSGTSMAVQHVPSIPPGVFNGSDAENCLQTLENNFTVFANNIIFGGTASVYFGSAP